MPMLGMLFGVGRCCHCRKLFFWFAGSCCTPVRTTLLVVESDMGQAQGMWGLTHRPHKVKERLLNAPHATCAGYWAFGWSVAPFLVSSFTFPTGLIAAVYVLAIIQIVGCYQIYARPTFGALSCFITLSGPCTYILQH